MTEAGTEPSGWWVLRFWPGVGFSVYAILATAISALTTGEGAFWVMTGVAVVVLGVALHRRRSHLPRDKRRPRPSLWDRPLPTWGSRARNIFRLAWVALILLGVLGVAVRLLTGDRELLLGFSYVAAALIWGAILISGLVWLAAEFRSGYAKPKSDGES